MTRARRLVALGLALALAGCELEVGPDEDDPDREELRREARTAPAEPAQPSEPSHPR